MNLLRTSYNGQRTDFELLCLNVPGWLDTGIAVGASRCGSTGILNCQEINDRSAVLRALSRMRRYARGPMGIKVEADSQLACELIVEAEGFECIILAAGEASHAQFDRNIRLARRSAKRVLVEVVSSEQAALAAEFEIDGLIAKGQEAAGAVGEETTFILLQRLLREFRLPVWAHGGIGLHSAAACYVAGAAGAVLDSQLLLLRESSIPERVRTAIERLEGDETVTLGRDLGWLYRVYRRPGMPAVDRLAKLERELSIRPISEARAAWRDAVRTGINWTRADAALWPLGQDSAFAPSLAARCSTIAGLAGALRKSIAEHVAAARRCSPLAPDSPLAKAHGAEFPIVQGPMTRVSDTAQFAGAVAQAGGLPFLALALLRSPEVRKLLSETSQAVGGRPWGVGILGFVPADLRTEQLNVTREFRPPFAIIAGGRPDQAAELEREGITCYLHVPAPALLELFIRDGSRRFIFEGRECGGHIGPRTSFVLWETMIGVLLRAIGSGIPAEDFHIVFAGGIHDSRSAAMVAAMAAPLAEQGVRIGVLMGTAYLFTHEAVSGGAIVDVFQQEALRCARTVVLETGPGHATRCAETPFYEAFREAKRELLQAQKSHDEIREELEQLNLGRLRAASKAIKRTGEPGSDPRYVAIGPEEQRAEGMYMIGQLAALRDRVCSIRELHEDVSEGGERYLQSVPIREEARADYLGEEAPCDIAIVGLSCVLPKAPDLRTFWSNLTNKVDCISEIPPERFNIDLYYDPDRKARDKIYTRWGGFLDPVPFDPMRYGIPPAALGSIDPMQLLSLIVVDRALDDAGYREREFPRKTTSVIFGTSGGLGDLGGHYAIRSSLAEFISDVPEGLLRQLPEWTEDSFPGLLPNVAPGRVANRLDLGGINFTVDAACASSMAALYVAARELSTRTSDMAIVGGVDTVQSPFCFLCFSKAQALSPRGRCRPFDETADGIAISEGITVLVLKRLADAERDGDRIYAVLKAVSGSSDGRGRSLTAPRSEGQKLALRRAYRQAGFSPATVGLMEAHGTGTVAGDTTEIASLSEILTEADAAPASCAAGSVKSVVGHTKAAAGVTGVMKAALALHHKVLPPTLHVEKPNAKISEPGSPLFVSTEAQPWLPPAGVPRRAGVSSFGFGGTNFHAVLEENTGEFRELADQSSAHWPAELFVWNAPSAAALTASVKMLAGKLERGAQPELRDLASAVCRRAAAGRPGGVRLAIVASSLSDLRSKLAVAIETLAAGRDRADDGSVYLAPATPQSGEIAFLFPGQGSQSPNMLRDLALHFPEFRRSLEQADSLLAGSLPRSLSSYIYPPPAFTSAQKQEQMEAVTDTLVAQPALGAVEVAFAHLLRRLGVHAAMTAGHSYGEYVALCVAGVFSDETLFRLSEARGRAIKEAAKAEAGSMIAVQAGEEDVRAALGDLTDIYFANFNSERQTVLAGRRDRLERALECLQSARIAAVGIPVACAFHSPLVQEARNQLARELEKQSFAKPQIAVFSNTLGAPYPDNSAEIADLLIEHLVRPVNFIEEIRAMYRNGARLFVEVGPKGVMSGLVRQILDGAEAQVIQTDVSGRHGVTSLLHALARLIVSGVPVETVELFRGRSVTAIEIENLEPVTLPPSQWLVNGGRVYQLSAPPVPVEQIDVTRTLEVEKVIEKVVEKPMPAAAAVPGIPSASHGFVSTDPVDALMATFQQLMSQFLQTQSALMMAYLQGTSATALPAVPMLQMPVAFPQMPMAMPQWPMPVPTPAAPAAPTPPMEMPAQTLSAPVASPATREPEPVVAEKGRGDVLTELVRIASERTGYPAEILDVRAAIEADLGIDSIKRVEILSSFRQLCSAEEQTCLQAVMEKLTAAPSLQEIAACIRSALEGTPDAAPPTITNQTEQPVEIPRCAFAAVDRPRQGPQKHYPGRLCLMTDDETGIAASIAEGWNRADEKVVLLRHNAGAPLTANGVITGDLTDPNTVKEIVQSVRVQHGPIGALVHLLPLRADGGGTRNGMPGWHDQLHQDLKSLYALVRACDADLRHRGSAEGGLIAAVTGRGGEFGLHGESPSSPTHQAIADFIKTVAQEFPEVTCKIVDVDPSDPAAILREKLTEELSSTDSTLEIGLPGDRRLTPQVRQAPLNTAARQTIWKDWVFLLTGGARGITASIAKLLAERYHPTLILAGTTPLAPEGESLETAGISDPARLRAILTERLRASGGAIRPAGIEAALHRLLREREIRGTLESIARTSSRLEYHAVNVCDENAFGGLVDNIYKTYGRLDVVVHGAGIIEDKQIRDKVPESFDRVVHTKADSIYILANKLRPESLKCLLLMSSVTAAFGNRGQGDYGAANGVLNGMAAQLAASWPARVVSVNWGPWDHPNMVPESIRTQFLSRGVELISLAAGAEAAVREIESGSRHEPVIVLGGGPWVANALPAEPLRHAVAGGSR